MDNGILDEWANAIQGLLKAGHKVAASATGHGVLLGDAREVMVREVLMRFLPPSLTIGTGQMVDSNGDRSRQIDIIVYRSNFPIFRTLGLLDVFMLEGVVATIEVKSTLNKKLLWEALDNCVSVKKLSPCYEVPSAKEYCEHFQIPYTLTSDALPDIQGPAKDKILEQVMPPAYVFGYTGYASRLGDLENALGAWVNERQHRIRWLPDVIATEGCVVVKNDKRPFWASSFEQGIYLAKQDVAPVKYILKHLVHRLRDSIGMGTAIDKKSGIVLRSDLHTQIDTSGDWHVLRERVSSETPPLGSS